MNLKRDKPSYSEDPPYSSPKRRRSIQERLGPANDTVVSKKGHTVVVTGLGPDCSVLDLKSRFEIHGPISRTRFDPNGLAYVTFRSRDAAQSAISAPQSRPLQVMWATDPVTQWREGVSRKVEVTTLSSRLVRPELPLSRSGRLNKLGSTSGNARENTNANQTSSANLISIDHKSNDRRPSMVDATLKEREIVGCCAILGGCDLGICWIYSIDKVLHDFCFLIEHLMGCIVLRPLPPLPKLEVSEKFLMKTADVMRVWINKALLIPKQIAVDRNLQPSFEAVLILWLISFIDSLFNLLTLFYMG